MGSRTDGTRATGVLAFVCEPPDQADDLVFVDALAMCPADAEGDDRLRPAIAAVRCLAQLGVERFAVRVPTDYPRGRAAFLLQKRTAQEIVGAVPWTPPARRIETPRLVLTWPTPAQMQRYYEAIVGTDIFDNLIWEGPEGPDDIPDYWLGVRQQAVLDPTGDVHLAVIERDTDELVGGLALRRKGPDGVFDVGYAFAPAWHGMGYATEAVGALVEFGFREHAVERVYADVFVGNHASRRVVEKLGFALEGSLRHTVKKRGLWIDEWMLSRVRVSEGSEI